MSRDVITVGLTMRILLLYRGEYLQWCERFMNYLKEKIDGEAMIKSIQNGDQTLPVVAPVSLTGTALNAPPTLKDPKFWTAEEKKTQKIDRLARSLLIQGIPNDIYSLIDSNESAKDLWDALERQMRGSEYAEQDRKVVILYEYETFKANEGEKMLDTYLCYLQVINDLKKCGYKKDNCELNYKFLNNLQPEWKQYGILMRQTKNLMDINIDALYNILKKNQGDMNDALGYKKKAVAVTSDPLALITTLLAKAFNQKKYYVKPTNNNLRTSSASSLANKKPEYVKSVEKKEDKRANEKKRDMSKVKCYNCKNEGHFAKHCKKAKVKDYKLQDKDVAAKKDNDEQVLLAEDQAWMESSSDSDQEINANMVFMAQIEKVLSDSDESSSFAEETIAEEQNNEFNDQIKVLNEKNADLLAQIEVLQDQLKVKHVVTDTHIECQAQYAKLEEERYEYIIRYSALCDNDKQNRKKIDEQEILFDKMSRQVVEMNNNVLRLQEKILEKETTISELEGCVGNKDVEIKKCLERLNECKKKLHKIRQTNQTIHMIMPFKDTLYNGRKGIGFENPSYFKKAKDLRPSFYDEKVIGLGYTLMFLIHSDEALEIEKFKRPRENKIEFAYDYRNLNACYQTNSLKLYVPTVILEKIIIDLEDEVVSLLEKEKANLKTIESLRSKGFESSENGISESENQSENDCHMVEKECDQVENSKVIAPGMFKLSVSPSISPISMSKTSCDSKNVKSKLKRKRCKRKSSKQNDKQVNNDVLHANRDFVRFLDLDTFSSVRRPKQSSVIWKKKGSSNTSNVDLSSINHSKLNKDVKQYSHKDLIILILKRQVVLMFVMML
nr:hypothetical protein [Tanacetum cinerariifolium]